MTERGDFSFIVKEAADGAESDGGGVPGRPIALRRAEGLDGAVFGHPSFSVRLHDRVQCIHTSEPTGIAETNRFATTALTWLQPALARLHRIAANSMCRPS